MTEYPSNFADSSDSEYSWNVSYCKSDVEDLSSFAPIFILGVFVVGVLGNGSLIVISIMHKDMRTPPNLLIINMSLGDLLLFIFVVPDLVFFYLKGGWTSPLYLCKIIKLSQHITQGVSVLTFAALSYDRYEAIARPFSRRHAGWRHAGIRTLAIATTIWFISFLFSLPAMLWAHIGECGDCRLPFHETHWKYYILVLFFAIYLLPFVAVFVFYTLTALVLVRDTGEIRGSVRGAADRRQSSRNRLAFVILLAAILFAILWLPYYVHSLVFEFIPEEHMNSFFERFPFMFFLLDISYFCGLLSSCTNPILLYAVSSNYRRKLGFLFSGCPFLPKHQWTSAKSFTMMTIRTNSGTSNHNHRDSPQRNGEKTYYIQSG
ncbi:putative neuromedin-B receptor-like [Apostichopus japonicus]|uniref:Putative neuromedin-B receptor-like n=1 Tax=Stichopus japonicus TaxID=307972 RepID=A0A2G8JKE7_STIJA|nr:putative neuromedin-B receptor-like [Apostichopus japonicus]